MSFSTRHFRSLLTGTFVAGALVGVAGTGVAATVLGSAVFSDVQSGSFYDSAVGQMYNLGIIKGYDNGKFGPDDPVTRGQLAVMLQRFRADLLKNGGVASSSSSSRTSSPSSSSSSSSSSSTVSVSSKGAVRLTAATYTVAESATAQILIVRTGGAQGSITVDVATSDGTGVAGTDYVAKTETLTFANNETSKSLTISLINNPLPQGSKTFNVTLKNATNGGVILNPSTAVITITDNQTSSSSTSAGTSSSSSSSSNPAGTISLGATAYMVNENGGPIVITVNREGGSTGTVGIAFGTSNGTATSGSEYAATSGTITFNPGETTKTFSIPVNYNSNVTGNKVFNVIIGTVTGGASLGASTTAPVTIFDNESGTYGSGSVKLTRASVNVSKSTGYIDISVQRVGSAAGTVTATYTTTPLTASASVDYTSVNGTLTFLPGEATKVVRVPIIKNTGSSNAGKTFSFDLLGTSSNATLNTPTSETVTIDN